MKSGAKIKRQKSKREDSEISFMQWIKGIIGLQAIGFGLLGNQSVESVAKNATLFVSFAIFAVPCFVSSWITIANLRQLSVAYHCGD